MEDTYKLMMSFDFSDAQRTRIELMRSIAQSVTENTKNDFVLKGGTGLLLAYGLPRYSTDLDYDGRERYADITKSVSYGADRVGIEIASMKLRKDTDTTKRYMLHYKGSENKPLKIEISFRGASDIDERTVAVIDGIRVYTIEKLAQLKAEAFVNRTKARDIFDIAFILGKYPSAVQYETLARIANKVSELGIDELSYRMREDDILSKYNADEIALSLDYKLERLLSPPPQRQSILSRLQEIQRGKAKDTHGKLDELSKKQDTPIR